jgi:hypothetical protein
VSRPHRCVRFRTLCSVASVALGTLGCEAEDKVFSECSTMMPLDYEGTRLTYDGVAALQLRTPATLDYTGQTTYLGQSAWSSRMTMRMLVEGEEVVFVDDTWYSCDNDGVWMLGSQSVGSRNQAGDVLDAEFVLDEPLLVFPRNPKKGDSWGGDYSGEVTMDGDTNTFEGSRTHVVESTGTMNVDGETRDTVTVANTDSFFEVSEWHRHAEGVGFVKSQELTFLGMAR